MKKAELRHLAARWWWSVRTPAPDPVDDEWARELLSPSEERLWDRMRPMDRAHAVKVARHLEAEVGAEVDDDLLVAALMHDCGKVVADLGVTGRVVATLVEPLVAPERWVTWRWRADLRGRLADHFDYTGVGAALLAEGGSEPLVVAWAREHHLDPERWTVDRSLGELLAEADDAA